MPEPKMSFEQPQEFQHSSSDEGGVAVAEESTEHSERLSLQKEYTQRLQVLNISETDPRNRYLSWSGEHKKEPVFISDVSAREIAALLIHGEEKPIEKINSEQAAQEVILKIIKHDADTPFLMEQLKAWCAEDPKDHIAVIDRSIGSRIDHGDEISLSLLALLGEMQQLRVVLFVEDELARPFELRGGVSQELQQQLSALNKLNDPRSNLLMHKILDFVTSYMSTVQDHVERDIEAVGEYYGGFFHDFWELVEREKEVAQNYLVQKHLQEIFEIRGVDDSKKEGALPGVGGGASDETIYTFRHSREAYGNRLVLGVHEGYTIANPVLQVAPGYFGFYRNGRIEKIFRADDRDEDAATKRTEEYIKRNNPDDDYIYDEINEHLPQTSRYSHPSNKLTKLKTIWSFKDHLKDVGRKFFFDLSRINDSHLHPMVAADFLSRNHEYIQKEEGEKNRVDQISKGEFTHLIFPRQSAVSEEQLYNYFNLTQLHMRKKIEDDFGIKFEELDFWTQRHFLHFLETRDIDAIDEVKEFVKKYESNGIRAFLSLEHGQEMGDAILAIGERLPQEAAERVFAKYSEIVRATEDVRQYIGEQFAAQLAEDPAAADHIVENLLRRGKDLLTLFSEKTKRKADDEASDVQETLRQLANIKADVLLFASAFREASEKEAPLKFEEIRDVQFSSLRNTEVSPEMQNTMLRIYAKNYATHSQEFRDDLLRGMTEAFKNPDAKFYVFRYKDDIAAFCRFDDVRDMDGKLRQLHFAAFNANPQFPQSRIGITMLEKILAQESRHGVPIVAESLVHAPITERYLKLGFQVRAEEEFHGEPIVKIELPASRAQQRTGSLAA